MRKTDIIFIIIFIFLELLSLFVLAKLIERKVKFLSEQKNKLLALESRDQSLIKLQKQFDLIKKYLPLIDKALPDKKGIIIFLNEIEKEASQAGVKTKISFVNNSVVKEGKNLKSVNFSLLLEGSYFQTVNFIKKIENLPQVLIIKKVNIQSPKGLNNKIRTILTIKCYTNPKL